jgi:hypothetical protein
VNLETSNVATWLVVLIAAVGAAVVLLSAAGTIEDPALRLNIRDYIEAVALAAGLLAIGRGVKTGLRNR